MKKFIAFAITMSVATLLVWIAIHFSMVAVSLFILFLDKIR